jgi:hypothetical protein
MELERRFFYDLGCYYARQNNQIDCRFDSRSVFGVEGLRGDGEERTSEKVAALEDLAEDFKRERFSRRQLHPQILIRT